MFGLLVPRDSPLSGRDHVFDRQRAARRSFDERHDRFAVDIVRKSDDGGVCNATVGQQGLLDLVYTFKPPVMIMSFLQSTI